MSTESTKSLINILGDTPLVERLINALPEEIDGLINHLTDGGAGRIATGSAVKEMSQAIVTHRTITPAAAEVLIAELQHYGGNAAANLVRGAGIPYSELLSDTLEYLGHEKPKDKQIELMERALLKQQLQLLWKKHDSEGQKKLAQSLGVKPTLADTENALTTTEGQLKFAAYLCGKDYDNALLHSNSGIVEDMTTAGGAVAGSYAGAAIGKIFGKALNQIVPDTIKATLGNALSSHRVTLPCINHLILIRLRQELKEASPATTPGQTNVEKVNIPVGEALVIRDVDDNHAISIMQAALSGFPSTAKPLDKTKSGISRLSPLMQAAPTALMANEISGEKFMKVVINGPLKLASDGNGYRGFSHNGKHITEQVRLFDGDLTQVVSAGALFNVASFALAQKHLADISEKLNDIKLSIDRIGEFQKNDRESRVTGKIKHFNQIAESILKGERSQSVENQLEASESSLLETQSHIEKDIKKALKSLTSTKDDGKFGMSTFREKVVSLQEEFKELTLEWKLCMAARMMGCRLLCNFPGNERRVDSREKSINEDLEKMLGEYGFLKEFDASVSSHFEKFDAIGDSKIELQANREILKIVSQATLPVLERETKSLTNSFNTMLLENKEPVELIFQMKDGEIVQAAVI